MVSENSKLYTDSKNELDPVEKCIWKVIVKNEFFFYLTTCFGSINFVQNNNVVISIKLFFYLNQSKFLQSNKIELKNGLKISTTAKRFCK